ncbi:MAG TPA: TerB family tellurite resistance protein [Cyclobacteriaceae bacterium]
MDILNIFQSDRDGIRKSYVKNLIMIAMADGQIDDEEWQLLTELGKRIGLTEEEIIHVRDNQESITFHPPKNYDDRVQQIRDLVAIMTIDGEINEKELSLCKKISLKLDVLPQIVDRIIKENSFASK